MIAHHDNKVRWHADIKPDNILLVRGDFKLADPGFARFEQKEAFEKLGRERKTMVHGGTMTYGKSNPSVFSWDDHDENRSQLRL